MANNVYQQSFQQWYCDKFEWFVKQPMPFLIIYQAVLWVFYGFLWIPIWYFTTAKTIHASGDEHIAGNAGGVVGQKPFASGGGRPMQGIAQRHTSSLDEISIDDPTPVHSEQMISLEDTVDINSASAEELAQLPGFSSDVASKVVALRAKLGGFTSVDQLLERLKPKPHILARLRERMTCSRTTGGRTVEF